MNELFTEQELAQEFELAMRLLYFNSSSTGIMPRRSIEAIEGFLRRYRETDLMHNAETFYMIARLRANIERLIGAESGTVALVPNTSVGVNIVASGIPWKSGDRVLVGSMEFPGNTYPWLNQRHSGVATDWLPMTSGKITPEMFESAITPRTRLFAISSVQFSDGYRADLSAIAEICHERDIFLFVDGIQSAGALRADVSATGIDAFAAGGQKHMLSAYGTGFLYVSPRAMEKLHPAHDGWLSHFTSEEDFLDLLRHDMPQAPTAQRFEVGSLPYHSLWGMDATLNLLLEFGIDEIEQHNIGLAGLFCRLLRDFPEIEIASERAAFAKSHIVSIAVPSPKEFRAKLRESGVVCSFREGRLRFSFHIYNTENQVIALVEAIQNALMTIKL
ncbi:MAG TPA: aminotransferase class V-fold PLP-dependent enzyme [candidate division Zixibacteria bacterium]|nr:aminotransferase class V-fold PLP-dependent enzyme [candidate division Zixibacteria bacterium]